MGIKRVGIGFVFILILIKSFYSSADIRTCYPGQFRGIFRGLDRTTHYRIKLNFFWEDMTFRGQETIDFYNYTNKFVKKILLRLFANAGYLREEGPLNVVVEKVVSEGHILKTEQDNSGTLLWVFLKKKLAPDKRIRLNLEFRGKVPVFPHRDTDLIKQGVQQLIELISGKNEKTDYGAYGFSEGMVVMTDWFPVVATFDKNGWDDSVPTGIGDVSYFVPSSFKMEINVSRPVYAVAPSVRFMKSRSHYLQIDCTRDMPLILIQDINLLQKKYNGIKLLSFYRKGHKKIARKTLYLSIDIINFFEEKLGRYPYREFRIIEAPLVGGAGGMEFPAMILIADMLYKTTNLEPKNINTAIDEILFFTVAHEIAHQWFSAILGSDSKREPYIDEPLASYYAYRYFRHKYGKKNADGILFRQVGANYMAARMFGMKDGPVVRTTKDFRSQLEYAGIIYGKAPYFFRALQECMGTTSFDNAMKMLVEEHTFGVITFKDIKEVFLKNDTKDCYKRLFRHWYLQDNGDKDLGNLDFFNLLKDMYKLAPSSN